MVVPIISLFNLPLWPLKKVGKFYLMKYRLLKSKIQIPVAKVFLSAQINKVSGTWHVSTDLANVLFSILFSLKTKQD